MTTLTHHLQTLRQKPEHVRRRIAVGASAGFTAVVAIIWGTTLATTGAFALSPTPGVKNDDGSGSGSNGFALSSTNVQSNFSQLLGAVGAATGNGTTSKPEMKIVDGQTSSSFHSSAQPSNQNDTKATVIPF